VLHAARPGITPDDVLLAVTTLSFDIAGLELFLPLISGARVVIVSRETAMDGWALSVELDKRGATMLQATPATWRLLLDSPWKGTPVSRLDRRRGMPARTGGTTALQVRQLVEHVRQSAGRSGH